MGTIAREAKIIDIDEFLGATVAVTGGSKQIPDLKL